MQYVDDTSDDNLLLIFQPFNSLIYSFHINLRFYKPHNT